MSIPPSTPPEALKQAKRPSSLLPSHSNARTSQRPTSLPSPDSLFSQPCILPSQSVSPPCESPSAAQFLKRRRLQRVQRRQRAQPCIYDLKTSVAVKQPRPPRNPRNPEKSGYAQKTLYACMRGNQAGKRQTRRSAESPGREKGERTRTSGHAGAKTGGTGMRNEREGKGQAGITNDDDSEWERREGGSRE